MRVQCPHRWDLSPREAIALQQQLRQKVIAACDVGEVHSVAGVDIHIAGERAHAAVVVLSFPDLQPLEAAEADLPLTFPYIPGLLAFREGPAVLAAVEQLKMEPDLFMFDGQGLAHPRRMGIASHLGVILDKPSIGCAKSRLCGEHGQVGPKAGDFCQLVDHGEVIGAVLRTREGTNPVFISIGHKIDLPMALEYTMRCAGGYRVPEPTRWAHLVAGGAKLPAARPAQASLF